MMDDSAKMATSGGGQAMPASPVDFLQNTISELRDVTETIYSVLVRAHNGAYGEYQDGPQTSDEIQPDEPGKINELRRQVRDITQSARLTLRVAESLERNG